ncbi:hypothetical protein FG99_26925 [Pseudomonas sp. AAC]|nr:hypothetical protein FG99_26925 [Pseudomonas sp. AAC]
MMDRADVQLVAPDGVVIEAPADGWYVCECDPRSDGSDWCDDCRARFEQSWGESFDSLGRPLRDEP